MPSSLRRLLTRLNGWPRRVAALVCLLLAGGTALSHPSEGAAAPRHPVGPAASLRAGQVAVPVVLDAAQPVGFLHPGDRIGLLATPGDQFAEGRQSGLIADRLRVLAVSAGGSGLAAESGPTVLVAADTGTARRIAAASATALLPVLDESR